MGSGANPAPPAVVQELPSRVSVPDSVDVAVQAASEKKARDIVVLDVADLLGVTDFFVICSGGSDRQVKTIAEEVSVRLKASDMVPQVEGTPEGGWVLLDVGDAVIHVFTEEMRSYYDLERLWKDAPRLETRKTAELG